MIIVDLNQVMISNLMMQMGKHQTSPDENLLRHMILNSIRMNRVKFKDEFGDDMIIACDDRNYWRKKFFPYYKASRKRQRQASKLDWNAIFESLNKIRDELKDYFPYRVIQVDCAEADDIIGTLVQEFGTQLGGDPILILSGDKDFVQLQTYANVKQYDPTRKRWLKNQNPVDFLNEHIIKGDTSDGVPNFLSKDDVFVGTSRQSPVTEKKLDAWLKQLQTEKPEDIFDKNQLRNWIRNKTLIDLTMIPPDIHNQIMEVYKEQEGKGRAKLFNYFIKFKLKNLMENLSEF